MQKQGSSKKPFVEPRLTEEASLEDVTLMSGGGSGHGHGNNYKKGGNGGHGNNGHNGSQHGPTHGHGRSS